MSSIKKNLTLSLSLSTAAPLFGRIQESRPSRPPRWARRNRTLSRSRPSPTARAPGDAAIQSPSSVPPSPTPNPPTHRETKSRGARSRGVELQEKEEKEENTGVEHGKADRHMKLLTLEKESSLGSLNPKIAGWFCALCVVIKEGLKSH